MNKTVVVNLRNEPYDVYIGREGNNSGYFGNPYRIGPYMTREESIAAFREYFYKRLARDPVFKRNVLALKGLRLACFCKPSRCHGDIYVEYLENPGTIK